jgi:LysR family glycine cleavage system transcriptional activator
MPAFFADELARGLLVQPFPIVRQTSDTHYWLVYAEARRRAPKIRAFRDWILAEAAAASEGLGTTHQQNSALQAR